MERQKLNCSLNARREDRGPPGQIWEVCSMWELSVGARIVLPTLLFFLSEFSSVVYWQLAWDWWKKNNEEEHFLCKWPSHSHVLYLSCFSRGTSRWGESGKMSVICLSESGEVLMRGLELQHYLCCCCWDGAAFKSTNTVTASTPSLRCITFFLSFCLSLSLLCFSHSFTHTSLFLGLSPLCLTIFLSLWFSQSLQSSISLLL